MSRVEQGGGDEGEKKEKRKKKKKRRRRNEISQAVESIFFVWVCMCIIGTELDEY